LTFAKAHYLVEEKKKMICNALDRQIVVGPEQVFIGLLINQSEKFDIKF
jgi:hypothetical protein